MAQKFLILILLLISLTGCENVPIWKYSMFERPQGNGQYHPLYIKGWKDGCQSGAQSASNYFYRAHYQFTQDWQLLDNKFYVNGWEDSYNNCRKYIVAHNLANS